MRVFRFLRRFNTVAASILLIIGIITAVVLLTSLIGMGPGMVGSGSYSGSKGQADAGLSVNRLNEQGVGEYLLYYRSESYREKRDLLLVDAQDGRHRRLLGDVEAIVTGDTVVKDTGLLLEVREMANNDAADTLHSVIFVRFADFREFTIASHVGGMDFGDSLGEGRFSLVLTGEAEGASRFVVFDAIKGQLATSVPLPLSAVSEEAGPTALVVEADASGP